MTKATKMASRRAAPKNDVPEFTEERLSVLYELAIEYHDLCRLLIDHCIDRDATLVRSLVVRLRDVVETMAKTAYGKDDELNDALRQTHAGYFQVGHVNSSPIGTGGAA